MSTTDLDVAVSSFADQVGTSDPVTVTGLGTRGGPVAAARTVSAPSGIGWIQPEEMTMRCGAATPMVEVADALAAFGQCVAIPTSGTVGGALAVGRSGLRRLGWGPMRDALLQVHYISAAGEVVKGGGPTVKNVSGFDLCRLLVGSQGTLGFLADVILRTRPLPVGERWFRSSGDPWTLLCGLYRPTAVLWDGTTTWVLLDGHPDDVAGQARRYDLEATDGPPELPPHRWSVPPASITDLDAAEGRFVAEVGVGVVHRHAPPPVNHATSSVVELNRRVKLAFDPTGRLNPGVDPLSGT